MQLMCAPLQGLTEAPWRRVHAQIYGAAGEYFTPFVRFERGEVRRRDLRDATSELDDPARCTPQIIAANTAEFLAIAQALASHGHRRMDLNLGCPFPPQVHHGRGAGLLAEPDRLAEVAEAMSPEIEWSVKMRLGVDSPDQWRKVIGIINGMPLRHISVHPRTATQQYRGELMLDQFAGLLSEARHPVIFNGEIHSPADINAIAGRFPGIAGVMAGRGLLERPSLFAEFIAGEEWRAETRRAKLLELHGSILETYAATLCGDSQILMKMSPFWEYFGAEFERRGVKRVLKARTLSDYRTAVANL